MFVGLEVIHHAPPPAPESSLEIVEPDALGSTAVSGAVRYWKARRGARRFPARMEISPRDIAPLLRNIVLIRVVDGGGDYEYRIVGDAYVQAFGMNFKGMRLSETAATDPIYADATRRAYEHVRHSGSPLALRGWVAPATKSAFSYHETAFLPLGDANDVDHLLVASAFTPRGNVLDFSYEERPPGGELPPPHQLACLK